MKGFVLGADRQSGTSRSRAALSAKYAVHRRHWPKQLPMLNRSHVAVRGGQGELGQRATATLLLIAFAHHFSRVCCWHIASFRCAAGLVAIGGKADVLVRHCPIVKVLRGKRVM
jgi:hypothetical protein